MATLADIEDEYLNTLQDQAKLLEEVATVADDVRDKAIEEAIRWYEKRYPFLNTILRTSVTPGFYAVPADWAPFSRLGFIEFPIDQTPPTYLSPKGIRLQRREGNALFHYIEPNPTGSFRFTYTAKHALDLTTIEDRHEPIIAKMAVAIAAVAFAALYANTVRNNLDAVQYRSKEQEWRAVAKEMRDQANRELRPDAWFQVYGSTYDSAQTRPYWAL